MSYCLLCQDPDPQYFHVMSLSGIPLPGLQEGIVLEPPAQTVEALIAADGRYPGDLLDGPWLLVSSATRKVLSTIAVDNVQYFPAVLTTQYTNEHYDDYWLLNVIGRVACVDRERSTFERKAGEEDGALRGFEIDLAESLNLSMFRLHEDPRLVVIHSRVRKAMEAARLRGVLFQQTSTYDGHPPRRIPPRGSGATS